MFSLVKLSLPLLLHCAHTINHHVNRGQVCSPRAGPDRHVRLLNVHNFIKGKTRGWHAHILSTIGRYARSGPGKQLFMSWQQGAYMPYTSHIKWTHAHLTSGYRVCVCKLCVHACVFFFFFQCKHRAISPDQTLVCSWHGLLGYDTSRETQRTQ